MGKHSLVLELFLKRHMKNLNVNACLMFWVNEIFVIVQKEIKRFPLV